MRAPARERKTPRSISLPDELWEFAKEVGNGEYSAGIRHILYVTKARMETEQESANTGASSQTITSR